MKRSIRGFFVVLAIVMSLVVVQNVCAETLTGSVTGLITEISETAPYKIVVNDEGISTEISGVRYNYLCNQYNICLETGMKVTIYYYEFLCRENPSVVKYMAVSITVGDATVDLR